MNQPNRPVPKSEWELLDVIGRKLTRALRYSENPIASAYTYEAKDALNQLKSLLIQRSRKVE
jgi:hypothetical protein